MSSPVDKVVGTWVAYSPSDADLVTLTTVGIEKRINWGTPDNPDDSPARLSFTPASPPTQDVDLGGEFRLGSVKFYNYDTDPTGDPVEDEVTSATLQVQLKIDFFTISFNLVFNIVGNEVSLAELIPIEVTGINFEIAIIGFRQGTEGDPTQEFSVDLNEIEAFDLLAELIVSPTQPEECEEDFVPVFDPNCPIEPVCPIPDDPIIEDCFIPDAPDAITDCPDVDIPVGVVTPIDGAAGIPGFPGEPGEPGPPGQDGCTPTISVSNSTAQGSGPNCTPGIIDIIITPVGQCGVNIHITDVVCPFPPGYDDWFCCPYVCCNNEWRSMYGEGDCPQDLAPEPPCFDGELIWICDCDYATTTTTTPTTGPPQTSTTSSTGTTGAPQTSTTTTPPP